MIVHSGAYAVEYRWSCVRCQCDSVDNDEEQYWSMKEARDAYEAHAQEFHRRSKVTLGEQEPSA